METKASSAMSSETPKAVERHIEIIAALERQWLADRRPEEHFGDAVAAWVGSMPVVLFHGVWFLGWVAVNLGWIPGIKPFDPFPFGLLTLVVSLEAIFLSLFLLISQNRLTRQSDKRTHLDLQVNLLIETEVTKMLRVMQRMCRKLDVDLSDDPELKELVTTTDVRELVVKVERQIPEVNGRSRAAKQSQGPKRPEARNSRRSRS